MSDTIYAAATAPGRAAISVLRLSGPASASVLGTLTGRPVPSPRTAALRRLVDPVSRETLDQALVLWLPAPQSFTGEDVVELHLHGGRAVLTAVTDALAGLHLRPAEPGEFSRRAFENGRLDLTEAEGIADLVDAETDQQRRLALQHMGGALSSRASRWRSQLISALAGLESAIDFPDEDIPEHVLAETRAPVSELIRDLSAALGDNRAAQIREGYTIALIGAPNAGKSTLLNALVERDAAIVTPVAGTTRDVVEVAINLAGYLVHLADTAGLRDTDDIVEQEGVRRARAKAEAADLRLWLVDQSGDADEGWAAPLEHLLSGDILVLTKSDQPEGAAATVAEEEARRRGVEIWRSSPDAFADIRKRLESRVVDRLAGAEPSGITRQRHRHLLQAALENLERALSQPEPELMAEDVRLAARELERLVGAVGAEDVLDEVFARFCIGK